MSTFIKLDPIKRFKIPKGFRLGKVIVNGNCRERSLEIIEGTTRRDDNKFLRRLQMGMLQRKIEWLRNKILN